MVGAPWTILLFYRKKAASVTSAPTGSRCSPPPPFRWGRLIEHHPRKGTETNTWSREQSSSSSFQNHIPARGRKPSPTRSFPPLTGRHFKTTSPQGDGTHKGQSPLIFLCFFNGNVTFATESRNVLIYTNLIDDRCFQSYR